MIHVLQIHHAISKLAVLLGLHHVHGSLTGNSLGVNVLHLGHVHLRVIPVEHRALTAEVSHSHGVLHGPSGSGRSWIRRHARSHRTTLGDLRTRHGWMHSPHHTRVWLSHVPTVLNLHGVAMGHTWMSRTHAGLGRVWTCLHHICDRAL